MGLINNINQGNIIYLKVINGQIVKKNKDKTFETYTEILGTIYDVKYEMDTYKQTPFEQAKIYIKDGDLRFCLQVKTQSGYFRGLCNSIKSGDISKPVLIKPHINNKVGGDNSTTIFVKQDGNWLKHFHPKDNLGDCPAVKIITFKGKEEKDGTEQTEFFKNWLISQLHNNQQSIDKDKTIKDVIIERNQKQIDDSIEDELPF